LDISEELTDLAGRIVQLGAKLPSIISLVSGQVRDQRFELSFH
jgi:hypothetical protein